MQVTLSNNVGYIYLKKIEINIIIAFHVAMKGAS